MKFKTRTSSLALLCKALPEVDWAQWLSKQPVDSIYSVKDEATSSYSEIAADFHDMNARGLQAFAVALALNEDQCPTEPGEAEKPACIHATFQVNKKSPTGFVVTTLRISNRALFKQRVNEGINTLQRYWYAGEQVPFDTVLEKLRYWVNDVASSYSVSEFGAYELCDLMGSLQGVLETIGNKTTSQNHEEEDSYYSLEDREGATSEDDLLDDALTDEIDCSQDDSASSVTQADLDNLFADDFLDDIPSDQLDSEVVVSPGQSQTTSSSKPEGTDLIDFEFDSADVPFPDNTKVALPTNLNERTVTTSLKKLSFEEAKGRTHPIINEFVSQILLVNMAEFSAKGSGLKKGLLDSLKKIGGDSLPEMTVDSLLAAAFGCRPLLEGIGKEMGIPPHQLRFPKSVVAARSLIGDIREYKKSYLFEGVEGTYHRHIACFDQFLRFSAAALQLLDNLCFENKDGEIVFDYSVFKPRLQKLQIAVTPQDAFQRSRRFKQKLEEIVVGQQDSVEGAARLYRRFINPYSTCTGVAGVMTMVGARESGKSLVANQFARILNELEPGLHYQVQFIPMESLCDDRSAMKVIGSGSQYVESALGDWTSIAEIHPRTVFVFENLEKAHSTVQDTLITLLDKGEIHDNTSTRLVSFKQCFFIITSAAGADDVNNLAA